MTLCHFQSFDLPFFSSLVIDLTQIYMPRADWANTLVSCGWCLSLSLERKAAKRDQLILTWWAVAGEKWTHSIWEAEEKIRSNSLHAGSLFFRIQCKWASSSLSIYFFCRKRSFLSWNSYQMFWRITWISKSFYFCRFRCLCLDEQALKTHLKTNWKGEGCPLLRAHQGMRRWNREKWLDYPPNLVG